MIGHFFSFGSISCPISRVDYHYKCGLCGANYVGYTCRHLYQRVEEHKGSSSIGNHIKEQHGTVPSDIYRDFKILRKCQSKFECLIYEMLFILKKTTILLNLQNMSRQKLLSSSVGLTVTKR